MDYKNLFSAALQFLNRTDLKGAETEAMTQIKYVMTQIVNGELEVVEKKNDGKPKDTK